MEFIIIALLVVLFSRTRDKNKIEKSPACASFPKGGFVAASSDELEGDCFVIGEGNLYEFEFDELGFEDEDAGGVDAQDVFEELYTADIVVDGKVVEICCFKDEEIVYGDFEEMEEVFEELSSIIKNK